MTKKKTVVEAGNRFGVEPRDLTSAQRRELFTEFRNKLIDAGEYNPVFGDDSDHRVTGMKPKHDGLARA